MISRERFNNLQQGDFLIFKSGAVREIVHFGSSWARFAHFNPRCHIRLNKLRGKGVTYFFYGDINRKITGVLKIKNLKDE